MTDFKRDQWERPLILQPDGTRTPYARASTLAKVTDDTRNLAARDQRLVAVGLAARPDLLDRVHGVISLHDDPIADGKTDLNRVCKEARAAAAGSAAASTGTAFHAMCQAAAMGRQVSAGRWQAHLDAYLAELDRRRLRVIDTEVHVVNDDLRAAGTFDVLLQHVDSGAVAVGDIKSGRWDALYPAGVTTQVGIYATGHRYDVEAEQRSPIHPHLDATTGWLVHVQLTRAPSCQIHRLDLTVGVARARLAVAVREDRARTADDYIAGGAA